MGGSGGGSSEGEVVMEFQMSDIAKLYAAEVRLRHAGCLGPSTREPRWPAPRAVLVVPVQRAGTEDVIRRIIYRTDPQARRIR
jgi:hypothetical protein